MASTIKVDKIAQSSGTPEFTIPTADGTAGQFLKTDGSGVLAFDTVTTNPLTLTGSTNNTIPTVTAANALTGEANFTYDGNILDIKNSGTASSIKLYCENANAHAQEIKAAPHAGSSAWTLTLPGAAPTVSGQVLSATTAGVATWAAAGGGKVLQVLQPAAITSNTVSTTSSTFVDIAGVTIAITPSATSSKVLVLFNMMTGSNDGWHAHFRIVRDSTAIGIGDAYGSRKQSTSEGGGQQATMAESVTGMFLDSPSTTSATTYKLQWATESAGTIYLNRAWTNTDSANWGTFISTLTVMEIGA
jgi:uncharacterized Zn-binding protein involved in type VI secretion